MAIVEFDGPPSWSLDAREIVESMPLLFPVSLASRNQDGGLSNSTINIYDLTEK